MKDVINWQVQLREVDDMRYRWQCPTCENIWHESLNQCIYCGKKGKVNIMGNKWVAFKSYWDGRKEFVKVVEEKTCTSYGWTFEQSEATLFNSSGEVESALKKSGFNGISGIKIEEV